MMKAVILAGGSGERFWPLSTPDQPKQFLHLFSDRSLLRTTYERLRSRFKPEDVIIITSKEHVQRTIEELPEVPIRNIIGEPSRMNTGPACMIGCMVAGKGEILFTVPADHLIPDEEDFWKCFDIAFNGCMEYGGLFTFGINPTRADTGYGYIETGDEICSGVLSVSSFREKPDINSARKFMENGNYLWNSGMFLWKTDEFFEEMKEFAERVYEPLQDVNPYEEKELISSYSRVERISIDHCLMERSGKVRVVPGDFRWSDVGTWLSLKDLQGSSSGDGNTSLIDSQNIFLVSETGRKIAVLGLRDIIVIDTADGLLICNDRSAQIVRDASRELNSGDD